MKKVITNATALGMSAAMAATLLAGCGSSASSAAASSTASSTTASSTEAATTDSAASDISVLGVDWGYSPVNGSEMEKYWDDLLGINMNIQWVNYEDYPTTLNTLLSANQQPDVTQCYKIDSNFYYPIFAQAVDAGNFVDLTPYLFDNGNGLAETNAVMKNWDKSMWEQATYNGGIYILPRSKSEIAQQSGVTVRRDLMKKYGFETEPTTMDELKTWLIGLSDAATAGEGKKIYALDFYGDNFMSDRVKAFAVAFTGQMDWGIDANGDYQYMQLTDGYLDFLNWMKDLYDAGVIDPEFALGNADTSKWKAGNSVAFLTAWYNWNQSADLTSNKIFDKTCPDTYEAWCLPPVTGPKGKTVSANAYDIDQAIAISSACSEDKIKEILRSFDSTEETVPGYDLLMSDGIEGVHYTVEADGSRISDDAQAQKKQEGYVGAWNQIFLKTDADQITGKFMRPGAKAASEESVARAEAIKADIVSYLNESGLKYANTNLQSATYNSTWSTLIADANSNCVLYVMGQITEQQWKDYVQSILDSSDYKAIQAEFKAAAAA